MWKCSGRNGVGARHATLDRPPSDTFLEPPSPIYRLLRTQCENWIRSSLLLMSMNSPWGAPLKLKGGVALMRNIL